MAATKANTSNSPSVGKTLPRKARKPAMLPKSDGDAGVRPTSQSVEPWQVAIAKRVDALVVKPSGAQKMVVMLRRRATGSVPFHTAT